MTGGFGPSRGALEAVLLPLLTLVAMAAFLPVSEIAHVGRELADTLGAPPAKIKSASQVSEHAICVLRVRVRVVRHMLLQISQHGLQLSQTAVLLRRWDEAKV